MLGKVWRNPETARCYKELASCDKTHALVQRYAQECFTVERRGSEFYLKPDAYALALQIDTLLYDIFAWENLTERSYRILREIGDYRNVDFHEIADHYFENHLRINVANAAIEAVA
tara:strand:- start:492 stop:839 length:348 start_codon:yes stop_codon:yes gene_type:complete